MSMETLTEQPNEYFFQQVASDIGDLCHYSTNLSHFLCKYGWPLDKASAENFRETALDIYATARVLGDQLSFSDLVVYITAFTDILEERIKE